MPSTFVLESLALFNDAPPWKKTAVPPQPTTIPAFDPTGILPPFLGSPAAPGAQAPYRVSLVEVVKRFANSADRRAILAGLLAYRGALHAAGVSKGFQWLDGSFVEQVELLESRPPKDVDVVTFSVPPVGTIMTPAVSALFDPAQTKVKYRCDAYFVNLSMRPERTVRASTYWYGLFSHRRDHRWKGMLEIELAPSEDASALALLTQLSSAS